MSVDYPQDFLNLLNSVKAKRPRTVIQHILQHGFITSQELKDTYDYNHPPRAVRDVREHGIPLVTYRIEGTDGRSIAVYKFGNPAFAGVCATARLRISLVPFCGTAPVNVTSFI